MKITKNLDPIVSGISAALVISILAFLTLETSAGIWIMFSFGATVFLVFALHELETAEPENIVFDILYTTLLNEPLRPFFADLTPKVADKIVLLFSKAILTQSFRL